MLNKVFDVVTHLARTASTFARRDAFLALGGRPTRSTSSSTSEAAGEGFKVALMDRILSPVGGRQYRACSMLLAPQALVSAGCFGCLASCRVQVYEGLNAISEAVGPQFVMAELHKRAAANKNPKVGQRSGNGQCHVSLSPTPGMCNRAELKQSSWLLTHPSCSALCHSHRSSRRLSAGWRRPSPTLGWQ